MDTYIHANMLTYMHIYIQTSPLQRRHKKPPLPASQYMSATERHKQQYTGTRTRSGRRHAVRMQDVMQIYNHVRKHSYLLIRHMHMCSTSHMRTQREMTTTVCSHTSKDIHTYTHTCLHAYGCMHIQTMSYISTEEKSTAHIHTLEVHPNTCMHRYS